MAEVMFQPRDADPVPDAVMKQFLVSCRDCLRATWGVADVPNPQPRHPGFPPDQTHPKVAALESMQSIARALQAAFCGDGGDAVIGHSMVATSLGTKALNLRKLGHGFDLPQPDPPNNGLHFFHPGQEGP